MLYTDKLFSFFFLFWHLKYDTLLHDHQQHQEFNKKLVLTSSNHLPSMSFWSGCPYPNCLLVTFQIGVYDEPSVVPGTWLWINAGHHYHPNTKWENIIVFCPSSTVLRTCRINAMVNWSCAGGTWCPNQDTFNTHAHTCLLFLNWEWLIYKWYSAATLWNNTVTAGLSQSTNEQLFWIDE